MKGLRAAVAACMTVAWAMPAWAEDIALVLTNSLYQGLPKVVESRPQRGIATMLRANGFQVVIGRDLDGTGLRHAATEFENLMAQDPDRVVVVLSGHFAGFGRSSWLLGREALHPERFSIAPQGLSVSAISDLLAKVPGRGLFALVRANADFPVGEGVEAGAMRVAAPQGITLLKSDGDSAGLRSLLEQGFLVTSNSYSDAALLAPDTVKVSGYLPSHVAFSGHAPASQQNPDAMAEAAYWAAVHDIGTAGAAQAYLRRYPMGRFVGDAHQLVRDLLDAGVRNARLTEDGLNLSHDARKIIQRDLSLLGFDPRGIDGVFGRGTRAAIAAWQRRRGLPDNGFLTGQQVQILRRQAGKRAAELAEEARQRQEQQSQRDREYWTAQGGGGHERGLRAYLRRYPDGLFADQARRRLAKIDHDRRQNAALAERTAWDRAVQTDKIAIYRKFLTQYPNSQFAPAARSRIEEIQKRQANRERMEQAKAQENLILINPVSRQLVERRLEQLGLLAAKHVDGTVDERTRRAIRKFQRARNIFPSGYVTQITMVQLLAAR